MKKRIILILAIITTIAYMIWRIGWSLPFSYGPVDLICAILLLVAEFIGFIETAGYISGAVEDNSIEQPIIPKELYPDVDIFIATYNEETELLRKTVNGCKNMEYPDKNKVHIYICDDNDRPEMKALAKKMQVGYFRRDDHVGAKAGNLNNALRHTTSPYVATFDADMIPMHDFLLTVMPYFFLDRYEKDATGAWVERKEAGKKIGFVQTPQSFYNADLFQYNLFSEDIVPNEQNFFFQFIQSGRNKANAAIYAGSNTVLSREALNSVGGFYEKAITEDLATGLLIQTNGYASFALDEVHASGLAPTDIKSLFKQRDRWARGCIQTFRQLHLFTRKGMEGKQRRAYISSLLYWYTPIRRAIFIVAPILYSVFHIFLLDCTMTEIVVFWLPHYLLYTAALAVCTGNQRTPRLSNIYDTIMSFYLIPGVLLESVGIKKGKFEVTKKNKQRDVNSKWEKIKFAMPHMILLLLTFVGLVMSVYFSIVNRSGGYLIIMFWLLSNVYNLTMAIFFIYGRDYYRQTERFRAPIPARICGDGWSKEIVIRDISEGGLSFGQMLPEYIPPEEVLTITVWNDARTISANATGKIVYVRSHNGQWRYAIEFDEVKDDQKDALYTIIYDRVPSLPEEISSKSSGYSEFKTMISKKEKENRPSLRKQPRVRLYKKMMMENGHHVRLLDFDYTCVEVLDHTKEYKDKLVLTDPDHPEFVLYLVRREIRRNGAGRMKSGLYVIENATEFRRNPKFEELLMQWNDQERARSAQIRAMRRHEQRKSCFEFREEEVL